MMLERSVERGGTIGSAAKHWRPRMDQAMSKLQSNYTRSLTLALLSYGPSSPTFAQQGKGKTLVESWHSRCLTIHNFRAQQNAMTLC